jgi:hypothetical protein
MSTSKSAGYTGEYADYNWLKVVGESDKSVIAKSAYQSDKNQL